MIDQDHSFIVCVHDVCPCWRAELKHIIDALLPRISSHWAAAVIPQPVGISWQESSDLVKRVHLSCGEVLQHGLTHRRDAPRSIWSWLVRYADEFATIDSVTALTRIGDGRAILESMFETRPAGFVPPAWRMGRIPRGGLAALGVRYTMHWNSIDDLSGHRISIATRSWDCSRLAAAGWLGEAYGHWLSVFQVGLPCVVIHPADLRTGFFARALRLIDELLLRGFRPTLPAQFIE